MINAVSNSLKNYANFKGRATRKEFWFFYLFFYLMIAAGSFLDGFTGIEIFTAVFYLALLIPYLAVAVRRMHDTGRSGWYLLIPIYNLVLLLTPSAPTFQPPVNE